VNAHPLTYLFLARASAAQPASNSVQWSTLAWIIGAVVAAAIIIAILVAISRRPKSMEDGIANFSRSLQAVAPSHRAAARPPNGAHARPGAVTYGQRAPSEEGQAV
jgi:hypothetical protein